MRRKENRPLSKKIEEFQESAGPGRSHPLPGHGPLLLFLRRHLRPEGVATSHRVRATNPPRRPDPARASSLSRQSGRRTGGPACPLQLQRCGALERLDTGVHADAARDGEFLDPTAHLRHLAHRAGVEVGGVRARTPRARLRARRQDACRTDRLRRQARRPGNARLHQRFGSVVAGEATVLGVPSRSPGSGRGTTPSARGRGGPRSRPRGPPGRGKGHGRADETSRLEQPVPVFRWVLKEGAGSHRLDAAPRAGARRKRTCGPFGRRSRSGSRDEGPDPRLRRGAARDAAPDSRARDANAACAVMARSDPGCHRVSLNRAVSELRGLPLRPGQTGATSCRRGRRGTTRRGERTW